MLARRSANFVRAATCIMALLTLALVSVNATALGTAPEDWSTADAAHLLRRAGFSGTPDQISRLHALGKTAAVDYLLTGKLPAAVPPENAPFTPVVVQPFKIDPPPADAKAGKNKRGDQELRAQWLTRMVQTDRPLQEKMSLFWHGLFTSGIREVKSTDQMFAQNILFHDFALGNYKDLTRAMLHDPAMLKYLNNNENVKGKPNENLARELCELFTMGEGQGYTEKDVGEIARALTGATVAGKKNAQGEYLFRANTHDNAPKTIFGKTGNYKPDDVVDLIFQQHEPADHLARRLWEFFAAPDPTDAQIAPVAAALRDNNFEVAPALKALFTSPDFYSEKARFAVIKSPVDLIVSTARILENPLEQPAEQRAAAAIVGTMGQQLFEPPNVRGWPGGENWITAATLFSRYNTATSLVYDNLRPERQKPAAQPKRQRPFQPEGGPPGPDAALSKKLFLTLPSEPTADQVVNAAVARFLQRPLHPEKLKVLIDSLGSAPLRLGDPSTDTRIRQMLGLLLSTPEYQVE